jgi:hypothetical protein
LQLIIDVLGGLADHQEAKQHSVKYYWFVDRWLNERPAHVASDGL